MKDKLNQLKLIVFDALRSLSLNRSTLRKVYNVSDLLKQFVSE